MNNTTARRRTTAIIIVPGSTTKEKKWQKFHPTSPRKCSNTRRGEPPAINNQNARFNRNIGAQKSFY